MQGQRLGPIRDMVFFAVVSRARRERWVFFLVQPPRGGEGALTGGIPRLITPIRPVRRAAAFICVNHLDSVPPTIVRSPYSSASLLSSPLRQVNPVYPSSDLLHTILAVCHPVLRQDGTMLGGASGLEGDRDSAEAAQVNASVPHPLNCLHTC